MFMRTVPHTHHHIIEVICFCVFNNSEILHCPTQMFPVFSDPVANLNKWENSQSHVRVTKIKKVQYISFKHRMNRLKWFYSSTRKRLNYKEKWTSQNKNPHRSIKYCTEKCSLKAQQQQKINKTKFMKDWILILDFSSS